jgi:16S rRNA (cytosine967-C5)-methyltransferase
MIAPARSAALHGLRSVAARRADLPAALVQARAQLTDERDRALAADIMTGTLRWQRSLDHLIEHFAARPISKLDPDVLLIVRLSLYQLLHLDRVPASAVVDDAVDLTRSVKKQSAAGFVNAVLRSTLRNRHRLPLPPRPDVSGDEEAAAAYLGITHSHPDWLVRRWLRRYGLHDAERWVRFNNEPAPLTIRANTLRLSRDQLAATLAQDGIETEPTRYAPDGLVVRTGNPLQLATGNPAKAGLHGNPVEAGLHGNPAKVGLHASEFIVQDEASQLVPLAVDAQPGMRILDLCASPGGKTIALAATAGGGVVVASDVRPRRIRTLVQTVAASGARNVRIVYVPAAGTLPFTTTFDRILVDAPCSGLGTVRRDPDIRWRRAEDDLVTFGERQLELLRRAATVLHPGGRLVYATCSSEPDENESVVERFLTAESGFDLVDLRVTPLLEPFIDRDGMLRTLPFAHGLEAFFAAALVRR